MAAIQNTNTYNSYSNNWVNTHRATGIPAVGNNVLGDNAAKLAITTTNISIFSNDMKIGFVQSFQPSETRDAKPVQELGTEGVVQMVPQNSNGGTINITRIALYNSDLFNALGLTPSGKFTKRTDSDFISGSAFKRQDSGTYGNPFRTLKDQRVPLELRARTILPNVSSETALVETYFDCWLTSYSATYSASNIMVSETAAMSYADMTTQIVTGAKAVS